MNYKHHYNKLITRAVNRTLEGYTERHHIIPRCLGGSDDRVNLVNLTPEEHYLAHQLLIKINPGNHRLVHAATMMCVSSPYNARNTNKLYGWLRRRLSESAKLRTKEKNGSYGKPWYHDPETKEAGKFIPGTEPDKWISGRMPKKINKCLGCQCLTQTSLQNWCNTCRKSLRKQTVFKGEKIKKEYSEQEKINALKDNNGNIRRALFSLGLNDSGIHYRVMKKLKASLYPLATNQLKG